MRWRNKRRIQGREDAYDGIVRENGKGNQILDKDGMCFTAMFTDDSGDDNLTFTIEDIDFACIGSVKSPFMMRTGRAGDRIKIDGIDNVIIRCLI